MCVCVNRGRKKTNYPVDISSGRSDELGKVVLLVQGRTAENVMENGRIN